MKKQPRWRVSKSTELDFHDINLNIFTGKYGQVSTARRIAWALAPVALTATIGMVLPTYLADNRAGDEVKSIQEEIERTNLHLLEARIAADEAQQLQDRIDELTTVLEQQRAEHQQMMGQGYQPSGDLGLITSALSEGSLFTEIETGPEEVIIRGETSDTGTVISYALALSSSGQFSDIRIAEMDATAGDPEGGDNPKVVFAIIITR
jgi:hypothetical protein